MVAEAGSTDVIPRAARGRRDLYLWRRLLAATLLACVVAGLLVVALSLPGSRSSRRGLRPVEVLDVSGRSTMISLTGSGPQRFAVLLETLRQRLPAHITVSRGAAQITYKLDLRATALQAASRGLHGAVLTAVRHPVSVSISAPVIAQGLRNDCEATALSILLASTGVSVTQQQLQRELPRSGPLDPQETSAGRVWGDPDLGFVGRAEGGGPAGGFGVYPGPITRLASLHRRGLQNLTGSPVQMLYARLLAGHAVMAWVALSNGSYGSWVSPQGKPIRVNFGEHTVVLTGLHGSQISVDDPLTGSLETWSRSTFEAMWQGLGRRAVS